MASLIHSVSESETSNLLRGVKSIPVHQRKKICSLKHLYLPSKASILILLWTVIVGVMYYAIITLSAVATFSTPEAQPILSIFSPVPYAILALVMMFYPLCGFIADVCYGRLRTVVASLLLLLLCSGSMLIITLVLCTTASTYRSFYTLFQMQGIPVLILVLLSLISFVVGLAGYQANFIQLGLDQLFEAPSQSLGLFIHYATWIFNSAGSLVFFMVPIVFCSPVKRTISALTIQILLLMTFSMLLMITCWKRHLFHSEPGIMNNPYKTVCSMMRFVKKHKYPIRRSAFTHCDDYIPSRLDFAKERYGGPFTTEQVENVKTFLRILLVLFAVGPVFSMEVATSVYVFPLASLHMLSDYKLNGWCNRKEIWKLLLGTGSIKGAITSVILFPAYIWIVFSLLWKKVPKTFTRLGVGIVIYLLGVISLLVIDVVGHSMNTQNTTNQTLCMFRATLTPLKKAFTYPTLNMHWAVLIPSNLLLGIGPLIVIATAFEFISAQSPQSMKGLLVGVFFAIRGLFQFLNSIIIIPLSLKQPWASAQMIEHPPVTNCGFVYLLLTCVTGLIGLILFLLVAKRYKFRTRDEGMFRQEVVEDIYDRYLTQAATNDFSYENTGDD